MVGIIKNILFGQSDAQITKRQSSPTPLATSTTPQNDPNREREILRRRALLIHHQKEE
ncbi:MAG: hypothetical protein AAB532_00605 [Patescibacteria group bacterium]